MRAAPSSSFLALGAIIAMAGGVLAAFTGCGTVKSSVTGAEYVVVAPRTAFYRFGPSQNTGPDSMLDLGTRVTLVSREYGYSRFRTKGGVTGYAFWSDFAPAPPAPPPLATPPSRRMASKGKTRRGPAPVPSADPLFDVRDVPLPELPESDRKPKFRIP